MEIRNDLSSRITIKPVQQNPQNNGFVTQTQQMPQQSAGIHSSTLREMANAMTLMQTASGIVQEALNVSSKLRSIALTTMATGVVDTNDIAQTLVGIKTSLQQNGGQGIPSPAVQQTQTNSRPIENPDIPGLDKDIDKLIKIAGSGKPDPKELSTVEQSLLRRQEEMAGQIENTGRKFDASYSYGKSIASKEEYSSMIRENPAQSILSQGNIRPDIVSSLI